MVLAIISRNLPGPAAHLSFMTKLATAPFSSRRMTLLSCPPISITVRTSGFRKCAPLAWQVISVILLSPSEMAVLPYPVVTIASMSSLWSPASFSASSSARSAPIAAPAPVGRMIPVTIFWSLSRITTSVLVDPLSIPAKYPFPIFSSFPSSSSIFMLSANASNLVRSCPLLCTV